MFCPQKELFLSKDPNSGPLPCVILFIIASLFTYQVCPLPSHLGNTLIGTWEGWSGLLLVFLWQEFLCSVHDLLNLGVSYPFSFRAVKLIES